MTAPPQNSTTAPAPVFLVEDDPATLRAVAKIVSASPRYTVCGTAMSAEDALAAPELAAADFAVVDLELPGLSGTALAHEITRRHPGIEVVILTSFAHEERVFEAFLAGASGYILKSGKPASIIAALDEVAAGGAVVSPSLAKRFWNYFSAQKGRPVATAEPRAGPCPLDATDLELVRLIGKGLTNRETASVLDIATRRVRSRLARIYAALGVSSRTDAVVLCVRNGWLELDGW